MNNNKLPNNLASLTSLSLKQDPIMSTSIMIDKSVKNQLKQTDTYTAGTYLCGLIDSDGSIYMTLSNGRLIPVIQITSKTNTNTISMVEKIYQQHGIKSTITQPDKKGAESIRVTGVVECSKLIAYLHQQASIIVGTRAFPLLTRKYRNLLLMDWYLQYKKQGKSLTIAQLIDFKKSFNKRKNQDPDLLYGAKDKKDMGDEYVGGARNFITRAQFEYDNGLPIDSSVGAVNKLIVSIDAAYFQAAKDVIFYGAGRCSGFMSAGYISGFLCGDGSFNVCVEATCTSKRQTIGFRPVIETASAFPDAYVLKALSRGIGILNPREVRRKHDKRTIALIFRTQKEVHQACTFLKQFPIHGDIKTGSLNRIFECLALKEQGILLKRVIQKNPGLKKDLLDYIERLHKDSLLRQQGPGRSISLTVLTDFINKYY